MVDSNFPAAATGLPVVHLGEATVSRAFTALLSVFPLDTFLAEPLERMKVDGDSTKTTAEQDAVLTLRKHHAPDLLNGKSSRGWTSTNAPAKRSRS